MMAWKQPPQTETSQSAKVHARKLRHSTTDAEKLLWKVLRDEFTGSGTHFRRQFPIGPYVADFCCLRYRLIIELDGPIHDLPNAMSHDRQRNEYLAGQGFRVLRFKNEAVTLKRGEILSAIEAVIAAATPTPGPSPQGGGEHWSPR